MKDYINSKSFQDENDTYEFDSYDDIPHNDCGISSSNYVLEFTELLKSASPKIKKQRKSRRSRFIQSNPSTKEKYETPTSGSSVKMNAFRHNAMVDTFCDIHGLGTVGRQCISDLKSKHPRLNLSRLGESLRGSIKVTCSGCRVIYILIWEVDKKGCYDIHVFPLVNCSALQINELKCVSKNFRKELIIKLENEMMSAYINQEAISQEEKFCTLSSFLVNNDNENQMSDKLKHYFKKDRKMAHALRQTLENFKVDIRNAVDLFDFASASFKDEYLPFSNELDEENEEVDSSLCPICYDEYDENDVQLMTCGHKACRSCWQ